MPTHEEDAVLVEVSDRLLELYVERDEACIEQNWPRAMTLQKKIEAVSEKRRELIRLVA